MLALMLNSNNNNARDNVSMVKKTEAKEAKDVFF